MTERDIKHLSEMVEEDNCAVCPGVDMRKRDIKHLSEMVEEDNCAVCPGVDMREGHQALV